MCRMDLYLLSMQRNMYIYNIEVWFWRMIDVRQIIFCAHLSPMSHTILEVQAIWFVAFLQTTIRAEWMTNMLHDMEPVDHSNEREAWMQMSERGRRKWIAELNTFLAMHVSVSQIHICFCLCFFAKCEANQWCWMFQLWTSCVMLRAVTVNVKHKPEENTVIESSSRQSFGWRPKSAGQSLTKFFLAFDALSPLSSLV